MYVLFTAERNKSEGSEAEAVRDIIPEDEELFIHPNKEATKDERINLYATALEICIKFLFTHSLFRFANKVYLSEDGGPIGLRVTMCVARIVMGEWGEKMRDILDKAKIDRDL